MLESISFRWILHKHRHKTYSLAVYLLKDYALAEDIVQESFIRLWNNKQTVRLATASAWLMRVTRNLCLDELRHRQRYKVQSLEQDAEVNIKDEICPERVYESKNGSEIVLKALEDIGEPGKSLIIMREIQGMNYKEIASALELSESQVKVYLHRTRSSLRQVLEHYEI